MLVEFQDLDAAQNEYMLTRTTSDTNTYQVFTENHHFEAEAKYLVPKADALAALSHFLNNAERDPQLSWEALT